MSRTRQIEAIEKAGIELMKSISIYGHTELPESKKVLLEQALDLIQVAVGIGKLCVPDESQF